MAEESEESTCELRWVFVQCFQPLAAVTLRGAISGHAKVESKKCIFTGFTEAVEPAALLHEFKLCCNVRICSRLARVLIVRVSQ